MSRLKVIGDHWAQIKIMPDKSLRFWYQVDPDTSCEFSLLNEVGEKYKIRFSEIMREHGLSLGQQIEFDAAPWIADTCKLENRHV